MINYRLNYNYLVGKHIEIVSMEGEQHYSGKRGIVKSVDSIGQAVRFYIDGNTCQNQLRHHILNNYSLSATMNLLVNAYQGV